MIDKLNISEEIDWTTVLLYLLLVVFGWMNIFASSYNDQFTSILDIHQNYGDQLLWIVISFVMIVMLFAIDHRFYHYFAYVIYGVSILLLLAVLVFGITVNHSRSWIRILNFNLQPSEFVKIATALALAKYLSGYNIKLWTWRSMVIVMSLIMVPVAMIGVQPDWGTAMVFSCFIFLMYREGMPGWILATTLFVAILFLMTLLMSNFTVLVILISFSLVGYGIINRTILQPFLGALIVAGFYTALSFGKHWLPFATEKYVLLLASMGIAAVVYFALAAWRKLKHVGLVMLFLAAFAGFSYSVDYVFHNVLKPHHQKRLNILLGVETDVRNIGYNVNQSKIAVGSGGFVGKGFLKGTQTKLDFVPEQSTDFIFCTVGEEWGFLGTTLVVVLYTLLLIRVLYLAERQRSQFARIYGYGVASILFFHFAINIAMTIGLFPVIGIPLPYFSYGGSSMLAFTLLLFVLVRLDSVRKKYIK
jgi:rod shape determining protein RodA